MSQAVQFKHSPVYSRVPAEHQTFYVVLFRASGDLTGNMVSVDSMEDFQKELDKGKVRSTAQGHRGPLLKLRLKLHRLFLSTDRPDPVLWENSL